MKITDFNKYFMKTKFHTSIATSKKPSSLLKKYFLSVRYKNYVCLNYLSLYSLLQQLFFFIQYSTASLTPFVFFIENSWYFSMYVELTQACNEYLCYSPLVYSNFYSWDPNIINNTSFYSFPSILNAGIAVSVLPDNYKFILDLIDKGWPCILFTAASAKPLTQKNYNSFHGSSYIIPTSDILSLNDTYFNVALITKIIQIEKKRLMSLYS